MVIIIAMLIINTKLIKHNAPAITERTPFILSERLFISELPVISAVMPVT